MFCGKRIVVRGKYERQSSLIFLNEKTDKQFNWKRPTVELSKDNKILYLNCFPGKDYVYHYASIVSSYISLTGSNINEVVVEPPDENTCKQELLKSNIMSIPECDIVILGTVEKLHSLTSYNPWTGDGDFCWSETNIDSKKVLLLGCKFSFWGDIAGQIVSLLAEKNVKTLIYTGKLGGLKLEMHPNLTLATGDSSVLNGKKIKWNNLFSTIKHDVIHEGVHYTLPSVIYEDKRWFTTVGYNYSFVDPEIGWMAYMAEKHGINFSYLHIISDNLARVRDENLSNERDKHILGKRSEIIKIIRDILIEIMQQV